MLLQKRKISKGDWYSSFSVSCAYLLIPASLVPFTILQRNLYLRENPEHVLLPTKSIFSMLLKVGARVIMARMGRRITELCMWMKTLREFGPVWSIIIHHFLGSHEREDHILGCPVFTKVLSDSYPLLWGNTLAIEKGNEISTNRWKRNLFW